MARDGPARPWWSRPGWRATGLVVLAVVLAAGFMGYQSPDLRANWEALAALCGF